MSGRANPLLKPQPHSCCAHATHLRVYSLKGGWVWNLLIGGMTLPAAFCPFCGVKLPREGRLRLSVVKKP